VGSAEDRLSPQLPAICPGRAPSDPEGRKGDELGEEAAFGISVVGVNKAVADTGSPSDEGVDASGTRVAKLFFLLNCSGPLTDTLVLLAARPLPSVLTTCDMGHWNNPLTILCLLHYKMEKKKQM
jgi:hypothetical protein